MWLHDSKAKINVFFVAAHIWKNLKNPLNLAFGFEANWSFSKLHFFPNFSPLWRRLPYLYVCFVIVTNGKSHSFDELSDVLLQSLPKLPTLLHCCIHCSVTNVCKQSKYLLHGIWRTTYLEYFHDVLGTTFSCLLILFASCFVIYIGSIIWRCM